MKHRATVVVGAHFGDEGKGLATDSFCSEAGPDAVAVRFSGGPQAGHTVVTPEGRRHVFHHLGAGTLADAATFLSRFFIVNPLCWVDERAVFPHARVFVDPEAMVTTPYDMLVNQEIEAWRGDGRHGSCGLGINETVERDARGTHQLRVGDLLRPSGLAERLDAMRERYFFDRLEELGVEPSPWFRAMMASPALRASFLEHAGTFVASVDIQGVECLAGFSRVVFEGSQGLRLDQGYGFFPHVTRGRTGGTPAIELARSVGITEIEVVYVTRAYVTRHGAGPLPNEDARMHYPDSTNTSNGFQGSLRFAPLDIDSMTAMILKDFANLQALGPVVEPAILVTCLDQVAGDDRYRHHDSWRSNPDQIPSGLHKDGHFTRILTSHGPSRRTLQAFSG